MLETPAMIDITREDCAVPGETLPRVEISEITIHAMNDENESVRVQLDMNLNHRTEELNRTSWFDDENMKRFLRLRVIQCRDEAVSKFVSGGLKTIVDSGALDMMTENRGTLRATMKNNLTNNLFGWEDYASFDNRGAAFRLSRQLARTGSGVGSGGGQYWVGVDYPQQFGILWKMSSPTPPAENYTIHGYDPDWRSSQDLEGYLTVYDAPLEDNIRAISNSTDNDGYQTTQAQLASVMFGHHTDDGDQALTSSMIDEHLSYYAYLYVDLDLILGEPDDA